MSSELITSWGEHDAALNKILALATNSLWIFDEDLSRLKLGRSDTIELLRQFLDNGRENGLRILLQNTEALRRDHPRLMELLASRPQNMTIIECPPQLADLKDSMVIADDQHALIRIHKDHARSRVILDSAKDCAPYVKRFEEILNEGGEPIGATTLGL